jgi:hypothetical protein
MPDYSISGYEKNYQGLIQYLKGHDFAANNEKLGLTTIAGGATIKFLGREYKITEEGVIATDGKDSPPNYRSILIHYATSPGKGDPAKDFLTLFQLPGVLRGRRDPGKDILNKEVIAAFTDSTYEDFEKIASKLEAEYLGDHPSGGKYWQFKVFPKIYMQVIFCEADDEFPAEIRVLFDTHAPEYLGFECLAFLNGCLCDALIEAKG